jgi:hypothetical protein
VFNIVGAVASAHYEPPDALVRKLADEEFEKRPVADSGHGLRRHWDHRLQARTETADEKNGLHIFKSIRHLSLKRNFKLFVCDF